MDSIVSGLIEFLTRHAVGLSVPLLGALTGFLVHMIVFRVVGSWSTGSEPAGSGPEGSAPSGSGPAGSGPAGDAFSRFCRRPLAWTLPVLGATLALSASPVSGPGWNAVSRILIVALILGMAWFTVGLIQVATTAYLGRFDTGVTDNLEARKVHTQMEIVRKIAIVVVTVLAVSAIFMSFEDLRELGTGILASAGVVGLIVGLAAQRTLGNVLAGFQIAITQPIRLDDVVIVEGEWGWIEEITLTYVVVRIWDQRRLVVPISYFIEKPFQNWTRTSADILGTVFLYLDHSIPVEDVRRELGRLVESNEHWDGRVWRLHVTDTTEKTVELRALMSAADSPSAWELRCAVREGLVEWAQRNHPDSLPRFRAEIRNEAQPGSIAA
ncbi:MAG: mechanosensitive ion channel [Longimicrobiales bacterium]|nr:mechanosensitive ion channel [Longimicrobiales bacterium]